MIGAYVGFSRAIISNYKNNIYLHKMSDVSTPKNYHHHHQKLINKKQGNQISSTVISWALLKNTH
jgi:hypothetical protein